MIKPGQKLVVYVPKSQVEKYRPVNNMSFREKQRREGVSANAVSNKNSDSIQKQFVTYKVKTGDTLWDIARKYPGVSDYEIMRWNDIREATDIKPGQLLKIKKSS